MIPDFIIFIFILALVIIIICCINTSSDLYKNKFRGKGIEPTIKHKVIDAHGSCSFGDKPKLFKLPKNVIVLHFCEFGLHWQDDVIKTLEAIKDVKPNEQLSSVRNKLGDLTSKICVSSGNIEKISYTADVWFTPSHDGDLKTTGIYNLPIKDKKEYIGLELLERSSKGQKELLHSLNEDIRAKTGVMKYVDGPTNVEIKIPSAREIERGSRLSGIICDMVDPIKNSSNSNDLLILWVFSCRGGFSDRFKTLPYSSMVTLDEYINKYEREDMLIWNSNRIRPVPDICSHDVFLLGKRSKEVLTAIGMKLANNDYSQLPENREELIRWIIRHPKLYDISKSSDVEFRIKPNPTIEIVIFVPNEDRAIPTKSLSITRTNKIDQSTTIKDILGNEIQNKIKRILDVDVYSTSFYNLKDTTTDNSDYTLSMSLTSDEINKTTIYPIWKESGFNDKLTIHIEVFDGFPSQMIKEIITLLQQSHEEGGLPPTPMKRLKKYAKDSENILTEIGVYDELISLKTGAEDKILGILCLLRDWMSW